MIGLGPRNAAKLFRVFCGDEVLCVSVHPKGTVCVWKVTQEKFEPLWKS